MDTLKDRLKILLEEKKMTQAAFADYINVARPNITHLMTGRDKFSQKIVSRILLYFPEINPRWLLHGEGEMYKPLPNMNQEHDDTELHTYPSVERQTTLFPTEVTNYSPSSVGSNKHESVERHVGHSDTYIQPHSASPTLLPDEPETMARPMEMETTPVQDPQSAIKIAPVQEPVPRQTDILTETTKKEVVQEVKPVSLSSVGCENPQVKEKRIRKIVFFYDDKSFEEYYPEKE